MMEHSKRDRKNRGWDWSDKTRAWRRHLRLGLSVLAALSLTCAGRGESGRTRLRLDLKPDDSYSMRLTDDLTVTRRIAGRPQETRLTLGVEYTFDVLEVHPDSSALVEATLDRLFFKLGLPSMAFEYDSKEPVRPDAILAFLAPLIGRSFQMGVGPDGTILNLEGTEAISDPVIRWIGDRVDDPVFSAPIREATGHRIPPMAVHRHLQYLMGPEGVREVLERALSARPAGAVTAGDSWQTESRSCRGGLICALQLLGSGLYPIPLVEQNTWKLTSRRSGTAVIALRSDLRSDRAAPPIEIADEIGTNRISYDLTGECHGTLKLDESCGLPVQSTTEMTLTGATTIESDRTLTMPLAVHRTLTCTMLK